jgi:hypothetical protein
LWSRSTAEFRSSSVVVVAVYSAEDMCTPSELVALRFKLRESYENETRKEPSATKPQLFEAIWSLFEDICDIRREKESNNTEEDGSNVLVASNPGDSKNMFVSKTTPELDDESKYKADSRARSIGNNDDDDELNSLLLTQTQAETDEKEAEFTLVTAKRASQLGKQRASAAKKERQHLERKQVREREHAVRREDYERKWGRPPVCPRYNRSEECDGEQCKDIGNGRFSHPDRCLNPVHVTKGLQGDRLLWHFWDKAKSYEFAKKRREQNEKDKAKPKALSNPRWGTKSSNNGGGHPRVNGSKTVGGKPRNGRPQQQNQPVSKEVADLQAQVEEMKTLLSLRCTGDNWPTLADPVKKTLPLVTPSAPSPTEALRQIASLLKAFT